MSSKSAFTFSDLFAGIGGFHAALHAAGGEWRFASEIDQDAARVYDHNWLRPLREAGVTLPGDLPIAVSGDIVPLTDPTVQVPKTDVLAAGFPCQPFSKSGFQRGMDETRGTLFWNIAKILEDPERRPSVVLLENVRNLAGPRHRDTTFKTIVRTLRELGYRTASHPAVFSPHLLPRELGGRPQVRERVFILAHYVGVAEAQRVENRDEPIVTPKSLAWEWSKEQWDLQRDLPLQADSEVDERYMLESSDLKMIQTWDSLLTDVAERLAPGERLPGFPIWYDDFRSVEEAEDIIEAAQLRGEPLPKWKQGFLRKNAAFWERHREVIARYAPLLDSFPASRRKFEWQAGPHRPLAETIMHFRPSGIRAKKPDYVPALVAITQTSILGERRRLTPRETARLQGLPDWFEFRQTKVEGPVQQKVAACYKQMGNGVNVGAAYYVFRTYVDRHRREIPEHIVAAVDSSPKNPDERLTRPG
jgi:DNA (cytosine-5)-methyltransferase 1